MAGVVPTDMGRPPDGLRQPLTAPDRPLMMRCSKIEKNTSAGIMDREVNASTLAVSTEYC